jgi:hypothetical protein
MRNALETPHEREARNGGYGEERVKDELDNEARG